MNYINQEEIEAKKEETEHESGQKGPDGDNDRGIGDETPK